MTHPIETIHANDFQIDAISRSIDAETMKLVQAIVEDVRDNGESAVRKYAERFGERIAAGRPARDQPVGARYCAVSETERN